LDESQHNPHGILALFPFLVNGALPIAVMREMRSRGVDVVIARYLPVVEGYTIDPMEEFSAEGRLIDLSSHLGSSGTDALEVIVEERRIGLVLQIGAPWAYPQLARLKERRPPLRLLDTLYNNGPHFHSFVHYCGCFDGALVESLDMVRQLQGRPGVAAVRQVESGVDLARFVPIGRAARLPEANLVVGYVGRMSSEKNPLGFVALAEKLYTALPWLRFVMFGEGPIATEVKACVAASPAAVAIRYLGYADHPATAFAEIDVLVVPSVLDGRPAAVMEANASGIPVIGAPVGGIPELIEEGRNGFVAAPRDHQRVAALLASWRANLSDFATLRTTARQVAQTRFDRRRMMDAYQAAYSDALAQPGRPVAGSQ
jgi:glycosyltransferase involved in cell wall biosynthesis